MENVFLTINGKNEHDFLSAYNHKHKSVAEIGLDWQTLVSIHDQYLGVIKSKLELAAQELFLDLKSIKGAYAVKYRIKDPEHLIDKIIRKKIEDDRVVTKENFLDEFDDFIGFRILHLFKTDWESIFATIHEKFESKELPVAYHRIGDDNRFIDRCKELGIETKQKEAGYRSIHYIAVIPFFSSKFKCEIQIRTIFEEAWSEIDHLVRYPNNTDNELLNSYLLMFNKLAGYADDMGTFLMAMKSNLTKLQSERNSLETLVGELRNEISKLNGINATQSKKIKSLMKRIDKSVESSWPKLEGLQYPSTLDYITRIQNPSGLTSLNPLEGIQESMGNILGTINVDATQDLQMPTNTKFQMPKIGIKSPLGGDIMILGNKGKKKPKNK